MRPLKKRLKKEVQPDSQTRNGREQDHQHIGVEGADLVSPVARQGTTKDGRCVEHRYDLEGERRAKTLVERVRRDIGQRDEECELEQEHGDRCVCKGFVLEHTVVRMNLCILGGWETGADEEVGRDAQSKADEPEDAYRPSPPNANKKALQHKRKDDTADGASSRCYSRCEAALLSKEVAD